MRDLLAPRARRALAGLSLLVLGASVATTVRLPELERNARRLMRGLRGEPLPVRETFGFSFDPAYSDFLEEVARRTPTTATVAIVVPKRPDSYVYQAFYQLAPRRVVEARWLGEADYVATYPSRGSEDATAPALAGGSLQKR